MHADSDYIPHSPNGQDSLSTQIKQRIHNAAGNPAALTALIRQLCPGLTPAAALAWLVADSAFEAEAVRQAARLLGGEWANLDSRQETTT